MTAGSFILAIDAGTTSIRAILFDRRAQPVAVAQAEFEQHYPHDGWVEHDPEEIWQGTLATAREALATAGVTAEQVAAIGITNQRETSLLWDRATGRPLHNAIVWQDRRTADLCARLREEGHETLAQERTGLLLDPYFSATKLAWLLDHIPDARARAEAGEIAFGTVDSFLLWRLTGGRVHATDATNASRTMLYDIHAGYWSPPLLALFDVPAGVLPEVRDNSALFGMSDAGIFGSPIPIGGMAGDQQAALIGQACFEPGAAKATYGTGCFMLINTGAVPMSSANRLLTTIGYQLGGQTTYAVEGSIFAAGAAVKWLRDGLGLIAHASESDEMAARLPDNGGVYMVPAFTGMGAPHWQPGARGAITGLTLASTAAHVARAALEAVAYQTGDLLDAMIVDGVQKPPALRVDGGMSASDWLCQFLSDILQVPVERPANLETTALGAAFLAGMAAGFWRDLDEVAKLTRAADVFRPRMRMAERARLIEAWRRALDRTLD